MIPEPLPRKGTDRVHGIAHEASRRMRVHGQKEGDEQMMRIPEGLIALLPDLRVRGRVHKQHAQQHDVACYAAGLGVVDLHRRLRSNHRALDVEEVDVVTRRVHDTPEQQTVCALPVEPLALV